MTVDHQEAYPANTLYHLSHLAAIEVIGDDASQFLQGQLTCNVNELTETKASIAAFCNPKGRAISTLLIIKIPSGFLLILPRSLLDKVINKLQMYVLRSKVKLTDKTNELTIIGLSCSEPAATGLDLPNDDFHCSHSGNQILVKLPSTYPRFLCITNAGDTLQGFVEGKEQEWRYLDISCGFPWFELDQSEKYIPQALNIDQLGGISFNKGCYTGQEIVARTHYLGQIKRQLCLAECQRVLRPSGDLAVKDVETQQKTGEVLALQAIADSTRLLLVLQTVDGKAKNLILDDIEQTPLTLVPHQ